MILKLMEWTVIAAIAVMGVAAVVACAVLLWRDMGWWSIPLAWVSICFAVCLTSPSR